MEPSVPVALLRGPYLTPAEMAVFEALPPRFSVTAHATSRGFLGPYRGPIPVARHPFPGLAIHALGGRIGTYASRAAYRYLRWSHWMLGLERACAGAQILHAADTYHLFSLQGARLKARTGARLVLTVWENLPRADEALRVYRRIRREVVPAADLFLAISEKAKRALVEGGADPARIEVLPWGIDLAPFARAPRDGAWRRARGIPQGDRLILYAGRLHRTKGLGCLLDAFARLAADPALAAPAARLVLAGKGEQERPLKRRAAALGIAGRTVFLPGVPHGEVPALYREADAFVLPSIPTPAWEEQFGFVLVEAMASGVPVIASESGSIPEVVGEAGLLVPPGDPAVLAGALRSVLLDGGLARSLSERGLARAAARFDRRKVAERLAALYDRLLQQQGRRRE